MADEEVPQSSANLARKVVGISAGEAHTIALTGDGRLYSWGRGAFGRLGTGSESDELFPVPVDFNFQRKLRFVSGAAGAYHSLAVADDGSVWCWGYNSCILLSTYYHVQLLYSMLCVSIQW
ncbi:hypothetical protein Nepgr_013696 [Nepenthes gracilis]|uniref:Uncharacterized protein n=1 Tax=Nepenthes gracilis TaxID=150966 RepID=A0AAD3SHY4_NEPGR|nr:hypothetical protein Nepgr_013696 [Nepenthes gracilis]